MQKENERILDYELAMCLPCALCVINLVMLEFLAKFCYTDVQLVILYTSILMLEGFISPEN